MQNRIDLQTGYFCRKWPKCRHGNKCPARYDQKIIQAARELWFKTRQEIKFFKTEPECMDEI